MSTIKSKWFVIGGGLFRWVGVPVLTMAVPLLSWAAGYHSGIEGGYFPRPTPTTTILISPFELP
jgi:hypothetical protein